MTQRKNTETENNYCKYNEEYLRLKTEFISASFRKRLKNELGARCHFCNSTPVEYHHMIPLSKGGTNDMKNIMPVCHKHHMMIHGALHIHNNARERCKRGGRPNPLTPEHEKAFEMYINGEIGNRKLKELVSPKADMNKNYVPTSRGDFKKWIKSKGISKVRNILDVAITNRPSLVQDGDNIGEITYTDGHVEPLLFHDTGVNDVEYTRRRSAVRRTYEDLKAEGETWQIERERIKPEEKKENAVMQSKPKAKTEADGELWWKEYKKRNFSDLETTNTKISETYNRRSRGWKDHIKI